jgi:vancomycin resistance protein VanJ
MARRWLRAAALTLAWGYLLGLGGWFVASRALGDRTWWLFFLNALALYLFAPLPALGLVAALVRQRALWLGLAAGVALFLALYGGLWLPRPAAAAAAGPALTVMTYNVLGHNACPECVVATIRAGGADLVTLQELAPPVAAAIARDLIAEYPYQVLDPREGVVGMGAISRLPLRATGETLPGAWVGRPQILMLDFGGTEVLVVNAHPFATHLGPPAAIERTVRDRYAQAQALVAFARTHPGPLLYPSDCNLSGQNADYRLLATAWRDAWPAAGRGFGHTYPGADFSGRGRFTFGPLVVPRWLVRIDYIWHSPHWRATGARVGPWDGHSDHRPVVARLVLTSR